MDNVVDLFDEDSGYIVNEGSVNGAYHMNLQCIESEGVASVRDKRDPVLKNQVDMSVDDMNRFCIMWLAINDPDVLKCDED